MSECSGSDAARNDRNGDGVSSDRYVPFYIQIALKTDIAYRMCIFSFYSSLIAALIFCSLQLANGHTGPMSWM
jgi:hypothetical protein